MRAFFAALILCLLSSPPAAADRWCADALLLCVSDRVAAPAARKAPRHEVRKHRAPRAKTAKIERRRPPAALSTARATAAVARMLAPDPAPTVAAAPVTSPPAAASIVLASLHPADALPSYADDSVLFAGDLPAQRSPEAIARAVLAEADRWVGAGAREIGVRRTLWCAAFFNKILGKLGLPGTRSDMAASFAKWGRPIAKPAPGAIAVKLRYSRGRLVGGHVVIVKAVRGDRVVTISPNARGGLVRRAVYPARVFYAYRMPPA